MLKVKPLFLISQSCFVACMKIFFGLMAVYYFFNSRIFTPYKFLYQQNHFCASSKWFGFDLSDFFYQQTTSVHFYRIVGTEHAKNYFTLTQNGFSTLAWIWTHTQNCFVFVPILFVTPTLADYLQLSCGGFGTITHEQLI